MKIVDELTAKNVGFESQKEKIDTSNPTGKFLLTIFAAIAELERNSILQRQQEGIAIAKSKGVYKGRQRKQSNDFKSIYIEWKKGGYNNKTCNRTIKSF